MLLELSHAIHAMVTAADLRSIERRQRPAQEICWVKQPYESNAFECTTYFDEYVLNITNQTFAEQLLYPYSQLQDDWDGQGAFAPTPMVIKNCVTLLSKLPSRILWDLDPEDGITVNLNGTLGFEWISGGNKVIVDVGEETMTIVKKVNGEYSGDDNCEIVFDGALASSFSLAGVYA